MGCLPNKMYPVFGYLTTARCLNANNNNNNNNLTCKVPVCAKKRL